MERPADTLPWSRYLQTMTGPPCASGSRVSDPSHEPLASYHCAGSVRFGRSGDGSRCQWIRSLEITWSQWFLHNDMAQEARTRCTAELVKSSSMAQREHQRRRRVAVVRQLTGSTGGTRGRWWCRRRPWWPPRRRRCAGESATQSPERVSLHATPESDGLGRAGSNDQGTCRVPYSLMGATRMALLLWGVVWVTLPTALREE